MSQEFQTEPANLRREIYLDWNATAPPHPSVIEAMTRAAAEAWANPSSVHGAGRRARAIVETARELLGNVLGISARDVVFTSGATEANNMALCGATALVTSRIEHPSVVRVAEQLAAEGRPVEWLKVPASGRIGPDDVREALQRVPRGAVVALMAANHETGVVQPVGAVADVVHQAGARLHVDATQALGKLPKDAWRGADTLAVAAHKIRGPKGIGALGFREGAVPKPLLVGGAQERGLRAGTVDPVAAAGFAAALRRVPAGPKRYLGLSILRDRIERELARYADVNGKDPVRLPHVTNLSFRNWKGDELVAALDLVGVRASSGSACSAGTTEPSAVIAAMLGLERAASSVRFSLGDATTSEDVDSALQAIARVLAMRSVPPPAR